MNELELPIPRCTYADHSYPAFTRQQMIDYAQAARLAALEEAAKICEMAPDCLQDSTFSGAARAIRTFATSDK